LPRLLLLLLLLMLLLLQLWGQLCWLGALLRLGLCSWRLGGIGGAVSVVDVELEMVEEMGLVAQDLIAQNAAQRMG